LPAAPVTLTTPCRRLRCLLINSQSRPCSARWGSIQSAA
jgi:hypothetical protein